MNSWKSVVSSKSWPRQFEVPAPGASPLEWEEGVSVLFPGLIRALSETPQDPVYHAEGDVWTHTRMVVNALLNSSEYEACQCAERGILFYAALLHDIAKPQTTREVEGRVIAPGHSAKGAIAARVALWEHDVPFELREQVCRLIEVHQVPFFAFQSNRGVSADFLVRKLSVDRNNHLLSILAEADIRGRVCRDQANILSEISLFREQAAELECLDRPYSFSDAQTRVAYFRSHGGRPADYPIHVESPFEVIMLSGLPASGKNHWVEAQQMDRPVVSYDDLRAELGVRHGEKTGTIVHEATDRMRGWLRKRQPFIVNATHLSRQMRQRTIDLVHDYGGYVRIVYCEAPKNELIARNAARSSSLKNTKLMSMVHRWEVPGLDEVEWVDHLIQEKPRRICTP